MRRILGAVLLTAGITVAVGAVSWNVSQATAATKSIQICAEKQGGSLRFSPTGASTLACRSNERAVTITQTASGAAATTKGAPGSAMCVDAMGKVRLNMSGTCEAGQLSIRVNFDTPGSADIAKTCVYRSGLIRLPGTNGRCDPNYTTVPVNKGGELLLPPALQRPWQLTPAQAQAIITASPTPVTSSAPAAAQSASPSPSVSPSRSASPSPTASTETPEPPAPPPGPEASISAGPWPRTFTEFAGTIGYSSAYPTPTASPTSGALILNTGSKSIVNDPANYANAGASATPCPAPSGAFEDNSGMTLTNCAWSEQRVNDPDVSDLNASGSKFLKGTLWWNVAMVNTNLSNAFADGDGNNGFNGNAYGTNINGADLTGLHWRTMGWLSGTWFGLKNAHTAGLPPEVRAVYMGDQTFSLIGRNITSAPDMDLRDGVLWRPWNTVLDWGYAVINRADLRGVDLRGMQLFDGTLRRSDLRGADLSCLPNPTGGAPICTNTWANFDGTDFSGANLRGASIRGGTGCARGLWEVTQAGPDGDPMTVISEPADTPKTCPSFVGATITNGFVEGVLEEADFTDANIDGGGINFYASTSKTRLVRVSMIGGTIIGTIKDADLTDANLTNAVLWGVNLEGAILARVNLSGANLTATTGTPVSLNGVTLSASTLCRDGNAYDSGAMTISQCVTGS